MDVYIYMYVIKCIQSNVLIVKVEVDKKNYQHLLGIFYI